MTMGGARCAPPSAPVRAAASRPCSDARCGQAALVRTLSSALRRSGGDGVHDPPEAEIEPAEPTRVRSEVVRDETLGRDRDRAEPALASACGDFLGDILVAGDAPEVAARDARAEAGLARAQRGGAVDDGVAVRGP